MDLITGTILRVLPLGINDISITANAFDVSDQDNKMELGTWPVKAFYLPDAISMFTLNNNSYLALVPNQTLPFDSLKLSPQETKEIVSFMKSLTDRIT